VHPKRARRGQAPMAVGGESPRRGEREEKEEREEREER
jgi:hypothetical protein